VRYGTPALARSARLKPRIGRLGRAYSRDGTRRQRRQDERSDSGRDLRRRMKASVILELLQAWRSRPDRLHSSQAASTERSTLGRRGKETRGTFTGHTANWSRLVRTAPIVSDWYLYPDGTFASGTAPG